MSDGVVFERTETRPEIVCLCGSTRFKDEINKANAQLTLDGKIVLSMGVFGHVDMPNEDWTTNGTELKRRLDALHKAKIELADSVLVINVGGYIGESTRQEILFANLLKRPVRYWEPQPEISFDYPRFES